MTDTVLMLVVGGVFGVAIGRWWAEVRRARYDMNRGLELAEELPRVGQPSSAEAWAVSAPERVGMRTKPATFLVLAGEKRS